MNPVNVQKLLTRLGWGVPQPAKRVAKQRSGWGTESEQLENRALLSASGKGAVSDQPAETQIARVERRVVVQYPAISGTWTITSQGEFSGNGTVTISQNGRKVVSTIEIDGIGTFESKGSFKRRAPDELKFKTPRLELPGAPIKLRLSIQINFPEGDLNPTTFTGVVRAPFAGEVATLEGTKVVG